MENAFDFATSSPSRRIRGAIRGYAYLRSNSVHF
jgi:hypothetical protein